MRLHKLKGRLGDLHSVSINLSYRITEDNPNATLTIAQDTGVTAYDAIYVALARALGIPLVTEDGKILRTCPDVARSMRQFIKPPESSMMVRERPAAYKTARKSGKGAKA